MWPDSGRQLTGDDLHLRDAMRVPQYYTDLRGSGALLCEFADLLNDLLWGCLEPGRGSAGVRDGGGGYPLSVAVQATHYCKIFWKVVRQSTSLWI